MSQEALKLTPVPFREVGKPLEDQRPPVDLGRYQQLRLEGIVPSGAERGLELEEARAKIRNRKKWLDEVEKETKAHREWYAMRHEFRAWYALQPQREARKLAKPIWEPDEGGVDLTWCGCKDAELGPDDIGLNLERCESVAPGRVGKSDGCGGVRPAGSEMAWRWYMDAMVARTGRQWCECMGDIARERDKGAITSRIAQIQSAAVRAAELEDYHGMRWCEACDQPKSIHPLDGDPTARYRAVIEGLHRMDAVALAFRIADDRYFDSLQRQETGYGLSDSPAKRNARFALLHESLGLGTWGHRFDGHVRPQPTCEPRTDGARQAVKPDRDRMSSAGHLAVQLCDLLTREPTPKNYGVGAVRARKQGLPAPSPLVVAFQQAAGLEQDGVVGQKVRDKAADYFVDLPRPVDAQAPNGSVSAYDWHRTRAEGQRKKFDTVRQCGAETMLHRCGACALQGPKLLLTCGNHRLCLSCRAGRVDKFQKKFAAGQKAHLQRVWNDPRKLQMNHQGPGGRLRYGGVWREKFMTLTVPHSGRVREDVRELQRAWPRFWRLVRAHIDKDILRFESTGDRAELAKLVAFCRVIEVTPGEDWKGHAHLHLWLVSPFIHHAVIAHFWGEALSQPYKNMLTQAECIRSVDEVVEALPAARQRYGDQLRECFVTRRGRDGKPLSHVWAPVIDFRKVSSGDMARELCKYLIKDGTRKNGELELIDPKLFAMIYAALEGSRAISTTRGLLVAPESDCYCHDCGGVFMRWIEQTKFPAEPRGPPGQLELGLDEEEGAKP